MLEQLVHTVESSLFGLGHHLLQLSPREQLQEDIDRLTAQLHQRRAALTRTRMELAAVKRRLRDKPTEAALLHSRIETALRNRQPESAYRDALELDQIRQTLACDQQACPRLEQTCWSLQFLIRQMERRLGRLQEQLYPS